MTDVLLAITPLNINLQGKPEVNQAFLIARHSDISYVCLDMRTKRCEIVNYGHCEKTNAPLLLIGTTEGTPGIGRSDEFTEVVFPDFQGWRVEMADAEARYTIRVVLVPLAGNES